MASCKPCDFAPEKPLQARIVRSHGQDPGNVHHQPKRHPHNRQYTTANLEAAYQSVISGKMSCRRAAEEYGIPRTTLYDKVSGKAPLKAKVGGKRYLTDDEESKLVEFLVGCASVGYAKSRRDVLAIAQQIARVRDPKLEISKGWWDSFRARHPEVTLRHAESISYARATANNPTVIAKYFDTLEEILKMNGLSQRPAQIFNCDETGLPLSHKPPKVVARVGQQHPYAITSSDKAQITVLACASASGYCIPPMVVFDRKTLQADMTKGEVRGMFYGLSESGWMNSELFEEWFKHHFLVHAPAMRPLLLLLDGHTSHYNPSLVRLASEEGVILFCLPPHTTHLLQPLDNGTFASLKQHWRKECQHYPIESHGKVINRYSFSAVFQKAWVQGMSPSNVIGCFRASGVYPVDRNVILTQLQAPEVSVPSTPALYLPFCTPTRSCHHNDSYIPASTPTVSLMSTTPQDSTLDKILRRPIPPVQHKARDFHQSARVLTSEQCMLQIEEKAEKKQKKLEEKERKRQERQRKKQEKEEEKEKRRVETERKKQEKDQVTSNVKSAKRKKTDQKGTTCLVYVY